MGDTYKDAAYRMYDSSNILYENRQWLNSAYLAGYVVECYCKIMLEQSIREGYLLEKKNNVRAFSHNLSGLNEEIELLSMEPCPISQYHADISYVCKELFQYWHPEIRYESDGHLFNSEAKAQKVHEEIDDLIDIIVQMELDGVVS